MGSNRDRVYRLHSAPKTGLRLIIEALGILALPATGTKRGAKQKTTFFKPLMHSKSPAVQVASYLLVAMLCALALWKGLLPGLLAVCLGFGFTRWLRSLKFRGTLLPAWLAATVVICLPLVALTVLGFNAKGMTMVALSQYKDLLEHMSNTVLDIRQKLPPELARQLPEGVVAIQQWLAEHLKEQASALASAGKAWLHGFLLAFVGIVVGALVASAQREAQAGPLTLAIRERAGHFMGAFAQIVTAQVWIAAFNAVLTAVFLLAVLPLFGVQMPYAYALLMLTFVAGLVPIVGNLLCNVVLAIVGVSVSPLVGLSCLSFLIAIHKFEYFINAKVVGRRTKTSAWELLAAMFAGEALFGVAGLVAAPLYYAYLKKELKASQLV